MTVVIIYPDDPGDLEAVPKEVRMLANFLDKTRLVAISDDESPIFTAIDDVCNQGESVLGLWFAAHADEEGVHLGSVYLEVGALVIYTQYSGAAWVVFNTCQGDKLARQLRTETGVATLGVAYTEDGEIGDNDAWRHASFIAREMGRNGYDLEQAHLSANPRGAGAYQYRPALGDGMSRPTGSRRYQDSEPINIHDVDRRLTRLETLFEEKIDRLLSEMGDIKSELEESRTAKPTWPPVAMIAGFTLFYFVALTVIIVFLTGGGA